MTREEKYQYLTRFLSGELKESELADFSLWLAEAAEHREMLEEATVIWEATSKPTPTHTLKSWHKVKDKIEPKRNYTRLLRAAMILALTGLGLWFFLKKERIEERLVVYSTEINESKEVILEDGSVVVLSAESNLSVRYPWEKERKMEFLGNAYFKVQADPQRPFKVKTPEGEIRVLGTAFYIDTRIQERENLVAVEEGKVRFTNATTTTSIDIPLGFALPNAVIAKESLVPLDQLDSYWMNHTLIYRNESMQMIVEDLEKIFKYKINIKNAELLQCKFSGKFKENNLDEILEVIAFALDLTINKIAGKQLTIIGKGCQQ